ncbi:xanthine dehydrogenase family protein molybdopterin-binding subunit [Rhizobium lusitanum]|uniref:xanthine dehydrogenase family protein molybdopterin-binding subunit n=1 Tax=Rhizobium lusitanum TaxID=293958 RepID=UPI001573CB68|nr:xanthine dehydrogenase family protein molybdopterin-binding subunit [Rhizobium lusitanum]NTJ11614.1 xanthine dehydrogenase family protein molybdopterin-binding subunit [Rhizobium lusitanum]
MTDLASIKFDPSTLSEETPLNVSRRGFLGLSAGALVLAVALPNGIARAQGTPPAIEPATRVPAFLEIRPDGSVLLQSPFIEGGQGIFTAMAQIVGEEMDADPARFTVVSAPPGPDYLVVNGKLRFTGGSTSVRASYDRMRRLGAIARRMLLQAAANRLNVPIAELTTDPGRVIHAATGRSLDYGALAADAMDISVPIDVALKADADFRWIGKPVARLDVPDKSTGRAIYSIDIKVDGMLLAAVQHAPRLGCEPGEIRNEEEVRAMRGVHSVHRLPGAVGVVADRWWRARRAAEALQVVWNEPDPNVKRTFPVMPADFSTEALKQRLTNETGAMFEAAATGNSASALASAATKIEAVYDAPLIAHAQLEPPSTTARFNDDGTLDLWLPNQAPDGFLKAASAIAGLDPSKIHIHSPMLGGFFGRHFLYDQSNPYPQAILLAKAAGKPVKLIWSREEEFLRDTLRPMGVVRFRAGLDANGKPVALEADVKGEGPRFRVNKMPLDKVDPTAVEGIAEKVYAIPNTRVVQVLVQYPAMIGFWRSVGHSMNDFLYEAFFDEMADVGKQDPFALRMELLAGNARLTNLLKAAADMSGGWRRGPYTAEDGSKRARGVAMASPFGTEVATIAEVSIENSEIVVHDIWVAIDPGKIVNPAIVDAQVRSAVGIGLSTALYEEVVYEGGRPKARNYDGYPILPLGRMPRVHVKIIESGAPMGGIGEPGVPGVPPAVVNAVSTLLGRRMRSLPLSRTSLPSSAS